MRRVQRGARLRHTVEYGEEAQRSWREGPVPGRVGSRGEADAPSDREGRPSTAKAYFRYAEPGAGSPTKGWRCRPSRRRRSPGLPFLLRQAIPGLPCLATKPFRGPAPCSGARMPRYLRDGALGAYREPFRTRMRWRDVPAKHGGIFTTDPFIRRSRPGRFRGGIRRVPAQTAIRGR